MTLTWEQYVNVVKYRNSLKKLSNQKGIPDEDRWKFINEISTTNKWIRKAEKMLKIEITGDWEFSEFGKSPYFRLRQVLQVPEYIPELPMTKWQRIISDPVKHEAYRRYRREYEKLKRYLNKK